MKLDRNTNPNGRGKYALINLRTNQVQWGGEDQFFVIKYKDQFATPALQAYARAVREFADSQPETVEGARLHTEYHQFADEIEDQALIAEKWPNKKIPD